MEPVQAKTFPDVGDAETLGADDGHRTVDEHGEHGPGEDDEDRRRWERQRREHECHERRPEYGVHEQESPRVRIQVAEGEPKGLPRLHPLIPAAVTPETKKRWKTRKMSRMGRIAMMLPAIS